MLADFAYFFVEGIVTEVFPPIMAGFFRRARSPLAAWCKGLAWVCLILAVIGTGLAVVFDPVGAKANWSAVAVLVAGATAVGLALAARVTNHWASLALAASSNSIARNEWRAMLDREAIHTGTD